jgi:predicted secreted protein|tara:strand:+ start:227 stop:649 length:423 start_codon:yes stop_codon:yes gene_type:complete
MATVGVFNGTNLLLKVITDGGTLATVGHTTSCSLSLSNDLPEATTKSSGGFQEVIAGVRSGEISFDGLVAYDDAANAIEMADYLLARQKIDFSFGTAETGDAVYSGEGFFSSVEMSAEMESPVTFSGSITVTGAITKSTN